MILTRLFDDGDQVTYSPCFSYEDARDVLAAREGETIEASSIGGNVLIQDDKAIVKYKSSGGHGFIFTDYAELCKQLVDGLGDCEELD